MKDPTVVDGGYNNGRALSTIRAPHPGNNSACATGDSAQRLVPRNLLGDGYRMVS